MYLFLYPNEKAKYGLITCSDIILQVHLKVIQYLERTSELRFKKGNPNLSFYSGLKQKITNIEKQKTKPNDKLYNGPENLSKEHQLAYNSSSKMSYPCKVEPHFIKSNRVSPDSKQPGLKR